MRSLQITTLAERLLYGPDKSAAETSSPAKATATSPTETTPTSPTLAYSTPTDSVAKGAFLVAQTPATSPVQATHIPGGTAETETLQQTNDSTASSPTVAADSPMELTQKVVYSFNKIESNPTSTVPTTGQPFKPELDAVNAKRSRDTVPGQLRSFVKQWTPSPETWHPTALQVRPLAGVAGIVVAIACVFASLTVLIVSDGQPTSDWYVSPAVLLAIITAIANSAIALAYLEAVPVSFWCSMARGRTVRSLERQWQVSRSVLYAAAKLRHLSVLNVACIAAAIVVIDGPLLQRASTVVRATQTTNTTLSLRMLPEIPRDFTGVTVNHQLTPGSSVIRLFPQYTSNDPMQLDVEGCKGKCSATIQAPAVSKGDCTRQVWHMTPDMMSAANTTWGEWSTQDVQYGVPVTRVPAFEVLVTPIYNLDSSAALMKVGLFAQADSLSAQYSVTACTLVPAIGEFDVAVEHGVVTIPQTSVQGRVVRLANNTRAIDQSPRAMSTPQPSGMDAIAIDLALVTNSNASVVRTRISDTQGRGAIDPQSFSLFTANHYHARADGALTFVDPTDDIVFIANELMFRAGYIATYKWERAMWEDGMDPGVDVNQTVVARQEITQNVYKSDLRWYAGAAAIQIATTLAILPMFWGWWELGCNLTLSPFSIALAFDAPVLADINSAAGPKGVVERLGGVRLKYGAVPCGGAGAESSGFVGRLGVAESRDVVRPRARMRFRQ